MKPIKLIAACAAVLLAGGALLGASAPALADGATSTANSSAPDAITSDASDATTSDATTSEASIPAVADNTPTSGTTTPADSSASGVADDTAPDPIALPVADATGPAAQPTPPAVSGAAASELSAPSFAYTFVPATNPIVTKIAFCHATGSQQNPYVFINTSVNAFYNAGHDTHQGGRDIVPPFSYEKRGVIIDFPGQNWDATGQARFAAGCTSPGETPNVATASVSFTDATCASAQLVVLDDAVNATWGDITDPAGDDDYSVTATAADGAAFAGAKSSKNFHGTLDPILTGPECDNTTVTNVTFCHATGLPSLPYLLLGTTVAAFFSAGHDSHQGDVVPPFSYLAQGQTISFPGLNWDADGQVFFAAGCQEPIVPLVATASVSFTDATCLAPQKLVLGDAINATWGAVTDPAGSDDFSVTATVTDNAEFAGGKGTAEFHGQLDPIDASAACDNTSVKKVEFCHATGSDSNPYVSLNTSVNAFFTAGHDTHQNYGDIVPPFSYLKQGTVIDFPGLNWDAAGQAFFAAGCQEPPVIIPPVATASVSFTDATCLSPQQLVLGDAINATWGAVTDPAGSDDFSVTATVVDNAKFDGDLGELNFHGTLEPTLPATDVACLPTHEPLVFLPVVTVLQPTCDAAGSVTVGAADASNSEGLTFTINGVPGQVPGSYPATAGLVVVTAQAEQPNSLEPTWVNPTADTVITQAALNCETTAAASALAFTGATGVTGLLTAGGGMVLLGIVVVLFKRRHKVLK
ncbi:MAG: hypothetical protein JWO10_461 [Microbacteriaceae bacterium]|nr:hypothetical protein [Microbacteriaceae bacterium]